MDELAYHYQATIDGFPPRSRLHRLHLTERLSRPFEATLELGTQSPDIDLAALLGAPAHLTIKSHGSERHLHGIVARAALLALHGRHATYRLTVVPDLWRLTRRAECRIFQNLGTLDILKKVLEGAGLPADRFRFDTSAEYAPREYCVQYGETDHDFIARLAEEEGLFSYFAHDDAAHVLVFADAADALPALPGGDRLPYIPPTFAVRDAEHIFALDAEESLCTGVHELRDYDFTRPDLATDAAAKAPAHHDLTDYHYPGGYLDPGGPGRTRARIRSEAAQAERALIRGESECKRLFPGATFTLTGHPRADQNRTYVILEVEHEGEQAGAHEEDSEITVTTYRNRFRALPVEIPYRAPLTTPRPRIAGLQSATVVGPAGEEIHTDEHGRIKVQFHWDRQGKRDDAASCWLRVAQTWAGAGFGALFLPRIGHEVLVAFLDGDLDRPIVTGTVYNGLNTPPYALPADKTKSTIKSNSTPGGGGSNELRFDDAAGHEEVYLHAQRDQNVVTENDGTFKVGHDQADTIGNDHKRSVGHDRTLEVGHDDTQSIGNDRTITIGKNLTTSIGNARETTIGQTDTTTIGADDTQSVGGSRTITIGLNKSESVAIAYDQNVGAAKMVNIGAAYDLNVGAVMMVNVGLNRALNVGKSDATTIGSKHALTVGKGSTTTIGKSATLTIGEAYQVSVGKGHALTVGEEMKQEVAKDLAIAVGKKLTIKAGEDLEVSTDKVAHLVAVKEIRIDCGSSTMLLRKNGTIQIKGKKITVEATKNLVLKGNKTKIN